MPKQRTGSVYRDRKRKAWIARLEVTKCNCRAEMTDVVCRAFRRFGREACPETSHGCRPGRVPKRTTFELISLTSRERRGRILTGALKKNTPTLPRSEQRV